MRQAGHRPASETHWRFAADPAVARPPATLSRTIATCCEPVSRQTQPPPARSPLRPPQTTCPNPHSDRGAATARPPACSFPAGFRTPALAPVASSVKAGIRNPQHSRRQSRRLGQLRPETGPCRRSCRDVISFVLQPSSSNTTSQPGDRDDRRSAADCHDARGHTFRACRARY